MPEHEEDIYGYKRNLQTALPQIIAVSVKNLILFSYGMTLGFPTIVIPAVSMKNSNDIHLDEEQISWFSSINLIFVPLGCVISGVITDFLGRRTVMRICTLPFIISWLLYYFANSVSWLYAALILSGFTGGLLEAPVLTYVAEITQPYLRGMLSATSSMCVIIGIFTQFFLGIFLTWRNTALVNILFPVIALLALFFIPESPHWLIAHNKLENSKKSLRWLRGWTTENVIYSEYSDLYKLVKKEPETLAMEDQKQKKKSLKDILHIYAKRSFFEPLALVSLVFFLGHFCGMTSLQTYAVYIFDKLQAPIDKYYATMILGIVQIVGAISCVSLVHFTGKRVLTFISTLGTAVCCFVVGAYAHLIWKDTTRSSMINLDVTNASDILTATDLPIKVNNLEWLPMTFLIGLAFLSHVGIRLLPWILIGEVFNTETRSKASGLASGIGYAFGFLANKYFLTMIESLTLAGTYWFYGCVILIGFVVFYFFLPETEGKTLSEIENHFSGKKKLTNNVARVKRATKRKPLKVVEMNGTKNGVDNGVFTLDTYVIDSKL